MQKDTKLDYYLLVIRVYYPFDTSPESRQLAQQIKFQKHGQEFYRKRVTQSKY